MTKKPSGHENEVPFVPISTLPRSPRREVTSVTPDALTPCSVRRTSRQKSQLVLYCRLVLISSMSVPDYELFPRGVGC